MPLILSFLLAGVILILGFLGDFLFKRTSIPDILILIILGFLIGPVFKLINPADLTPATQFFASLALLIILFDSGLNLNLFKTLKNSPRAMLLAFIGIVISMGLTTLFTHFILNWDFFEGLILGAIVGGTSSAIVIPIVARMKNIEGKISTILSLESVFTDALVVVIGLTLIQFLAHSSGGNALSMIPTGIATQFSIAIVIGAVLGVVWLRILKIIRNSLYDDILTLAIVLLFYSIVESLNGNGAIFALTFGLVLGNGYIISKMFKMKSTIEASKIMKKFHAQISFLIRTFFFVYLGLIISFNNYILILYGVVIAAILLAGRYASVLITSVGNEVLKKNKKILTFMIPRGLAAAVMAQIVVSSNVPHGNMFSDLVITIIVTTVLIASISSFFINRNYKNQKLAKSSMMK
jgi:cell volume regulation protein A